MTDGPDAASRSYTRDQKEQAWRDFWQGLPSAIAAIGGNVRGWNGRIIETRVWPTAAAWSGSVRLNRADAEAFRQMFQSAGAQHDEATLRRFGTAVDGLLESLGHCAHAPDQRRTGPLSYHSGPPAVRILDQGVVAAWVADHRAEFIRATGLDRVAPGLDRVPGADLYPRFVPATRGLVSAVAQHLGVDEGEVLNTLATHNVREKLPQLARMLVAHSGSHASAPDERDAVVRAVVGRMTTTFEQVSKLPKPAGSKPLQNAAIASDAAAIGRQTFAAALGAIPTAQPGGGPPTAALRAGAGRGTLPDHLTPAADSAIAPLTSVRHPNLYQRGSRLTPSSGRGTDLER